MAVTKLRTIKNRGHLKRSVFYICDNKKTDFGLWVFSNAGVWPDGMYHSMMQNKEFWSKTDQRQGYHYMLSFPPDENVNEELALKIAEEFTRELLQDNFYYVIAVHNDKPHLHAHIVFDSVSKTDGYKFHSPKGDWGKRIQPITDRLCNKYGLSTLSYTPDGDRKGKPYNEWQHEKNPGDEKENQKINNGGTEGNRLFEITPYDIIRDDIDEAINHSSSFDEFIFYLRSKFNYSFPRIKNKNYLSVHPSWREKPVRTGQLGPGYSRSEIEQRIKNKKYTPEFENRYKDYGDMKEIRSIIYLKTRNRSGWKMSPFQEKFYRRYQRTIFIRRPIYDKSWRYKSDVLQVRKISACLVKMLKDDINSIEDVDRISADLENKLEALGLEINTVQTRLYRSEYSRLVSKYEKLAAEVSASDDPKAVKNKMNKIMKQILEICSYEEAKARRESLKSDLSRLRAVGKSYKQEIKVLDDIKDLFYQPEHDMEAIIRRGQNNKTKQKKRDRKER